MRQRLNALTHAIAWFFFALISSSPAAELADGLYADFATTMGSFTCRLDYAAAPRTTANFVGLAEATRPWLDVTTGRVVSNRFYDGVAFHRVMTNFVIQAGRPAGALGEPPVGFLFDDEFTSPATSNVDAYVLAMANKGTNTNSSQFFITVSPQPHLDGKHTVFGYVADGTNVVAAINAVPVSGGVPITPVLINEMTILRVGAAAQAWDPGSVTPPLPVPAVLKSRLQWSPPNLVLTWPHAAGALHCLFRDWNLTVAGLNGVYDVTMYGGGAIVTGLTTSSPVGCFWVVREGVD